MYVGALRECRFAEALTSIRSIVGNTYHGKMVSSITLRLLRVLYTAILPAIKANPQTYR